MFKKHILAAAFCTTLFATAPAVATTVVATQQSYTETSRNGNQEEVTGDWVNSEEVNTIQESKLAEDMIQEEKNASSTKMTREEKARNAKENDSTGGAITIIAMSIVIGALVVLSLLFMIFGKISSRIMTRKKKEAHGVDEHTAEDHHDEADSGEVIAAIGLALAEHFGQGHDMEDTILTIKRMRKAYSPWNSKIYNLRNLPDRGAGMASVRRPLNTTGR
ncbi:MAG: OadG family protein [Muribaculaceae bacterium]|nr:OadG family protein [Muribaculaceae bacterium]